MLFVIKPGEDTRPIAYQTYKDFAKKYKIRLTKDKKKKPMKVLADEIFDYERNNNIELPGLYFGALE